MGTVAHDLTAETKLCGRPQEAAQQMSCPTGEQEWGPARRKHATGAAPQQMSTTRVPGCQGMPDMAACSISSASHLMHELQEPVEPCEACCSPSQVWTNKDMASHSQGHMQTAQQSPGSSTTASSPLIRSFHVVHPLRCQCPSLHPDCTYSWL